MQVRIAAKLEGNERQLSTYRRPVPVFKASANTCQSTQRVGLLRENMYDDRQFGGKANERTGQQAIPAGLHEEPRFQSTKKQEKVPISARRRCTARPPYKRVFGTVPIHEE